MTPAVAIPRRSRLRRLARRAVPWLAAISVAPLLVTLKLWHRSLGALDELYGSVRFTSFEIDSYGGRVEGLFRRPYQVRAGVDVEDGRATPTPRWDELEPTDDPDRRSDYVSRQRWPIGQTSRWPVETMVLPAPAARAWVAYARDGPGRYTGCLSVTVPYWMPTLAFAAMPTLWVVGFTRRRQRRAATPDACEQCGYDCRASPERCPECGTPRAITP